MSRSITPATPEPDRPRLKFGKSARLRSGPEFTKVRERGKSVQGRLIRVARFFDSDSGPARVGIITSRRVGGAVVRNRVRRRIRELVRHWLAEIPAGNWVVIIAKSSAAGASFEDLRGEWLLLARRLSILPPLP
ncbi:MAG: ribonuclease P protein component [Terrimicrobiaceae bacterium]